MLRAELSAIQKALADAIQQHSDAARYAAKSAEESRREPIRTIIVSGALGTVDEINADATRKREDYWQQERLIKWTKRAFIAASIYAGIAVIQVLVFALQWQEPKALQSATRNAVCVASNTLIETQRSNRAQEISSSKALQATIDNFHLEQRAWLQIGNWSFVMNDKTTPSYQALIFDSGKTPAIDVTTLI